MKIKLENVRLSFPDLFTAVQYQGQGPFSYRAQFLVPANSPLKKQIEAAIVQVAKEKWGAKADAILKKAPTSKAGYCFVDGDTKEYDGYAGHFALSATRNQEKGRPLVIDKDKTPLTQADGKPYAGCYVNASVEIWAQDNKFGQTMRCQLLGVQFNKDGDSFGGGAAPSEDDFEDLAVGSTEDFEHQEEESLV